MLLPGFDFLFHTLNLIVISINKVSVTFFKFLLRNVLNKATPLNIKALTETLPPQSNPGNFQWCQEKKTHALAQTIVASRLAIPAGANQPFLRLN